MAHFKKMNLYVLRMDYHIKEEEYLVSNTKWRLLGGGFVTALLSLVCIINTENISLTISIVTGNSFYVYSFGCQPKNTKKRFL